MTLAEIARLIGARLRGNGATEITGVAPLGEARAGEVTFIADAARLDQIAACRASALIVPESLAEEAALSAHALLVAPRAKLAFARAVRLFHERPYVPRGVSPDLVLGEGSRLGRDCSIHPRVTIGREALIGDRVMLYPGVALGDRVKVGEDTVLFANVSVYDDTEIGARCRIHSGTVIGSDGFSFVPDEEGRQFKLLQVGRVIIEDDVEIGANCCVDRAGFGATRLRRGSKFDNLIQIGHNCEIGEDTVVAALSGFSGGTKVGRQVTIAGQIGTNQHITIGDRAIITARTGVTKSVEAGRRVGGMMPAQDYQQWRRAQALFARLPELFERLKRLEKQWRVTSGE
jgi:UDP-3-O-[3-hydroxymyristoyl] glucosamine N-acyltransferase